MIAALILHLSGCAPGISRGALSILLPEGRVIDPRLEGDPALKVTLQGAEGCALSLRAEDPSGVGRAIALDDGEARWDGLADDGLPFDPGPVALIARADCGEDGSQEALAEAWVLRLGVVAVNFVDHPEDGGNSPLAWHKLDLATPGVTVIQPDWPEYQNGGQGEQGLGDLDLDSGAARPALPVWQNPDAPPWGALDPADFAYNVPAAFIAGRRAALEATPGAWAVSARGRVARPAIPDGAPSVSLRLDDWEPLDDGDLASGEPARFGSAALPDTLGREDLALVWRFVADDDQAVPGSQQTTHRLYRLAGEPALRDGAPVGAAPPVPWIGVLEDLNASLDGLPPQPEAVLDAVRDYLNENPYLVYNPSDAAYSDYEGSYPTWEYISSELSAWLDRDDGVDLYCHSVSCLLSTLVGHVGVDAPQVVVGTGFTTNLTRAAGSDEWRRWGFNAHSFVTLPDQRQVWDASIDIDGDDDPKNSPVEELSPRGLDFDEYLWRLTYDDIGVVNGGQCYFY